jgi:polyhydroxyalkanoate synthesis regulator phasin
MVKKQQSIQTSLLVIIITLETFFFVGNIIPVLALHKEQQLLVNYDDPQELADAVKGGEEGLKDMSLQSMKASNIYDDADESFQDCIYLSAKVGDNLADKEAVHCIEDVNFLKNKYPTDSSVPIAITSTAIGTSAATKTNGISTSNGISTADTDDEEKNLINELVKTGRFTEDEAKELVTKVTLINELVKTGKFTEDEAKELVTKVMKNGTDEANVTDGSNVPEANITANVPEANITANVPEANITANVPEANITANVPETNVSQGESARKIALDITVAKDPITRGDSQIVTAVASDSATGKALDHVFMRVTVKDPIGIIIKNYTATEGNLTRSFTIGENAVGKFRILATVSQAGVEIRKSSTFQVQ